MDRTWSSFHDPFHHQSKSLIIQYHQVQVTLQTDQVIDIPCGTSSGVILKFHRVEVVNRLRKEMAHDTIKNYTVTYDQTWIFSKIQYISFKIVMKSISFVPVTLSKD